MSVFRRFAVCAALFVLCSFFLCGLFVPLANGQIVIERSGRHANATILFQGIANDSVMSKCVLRHLMYCGWFDVKKSGQTDYILRGTSNGTSVQLDLYNGGNLKIDSFTGAGATRKESAGKAVDKILKSEFKVPGICCSKVVFSAFLGNGIKEIFVCDYDGQNIQRITELGKISVEPTWTPNGKSIIYCLYDSIAATNIIEYRTDLKESRRLTRYRKGYTSGCAVSPDGKMIAFVTDAATQLRPGMRQQQDLYIRPLEGGTPVRLTNDSYVEGNPCWTPDGQKICFVSNRNGIPQLYIMDAREGATPVRLRLFGTERHTPSISSDWKLAYSAKISGYEIRMADMTEPTNPKDEKIGDYNGKTAYAGENPSWAPDNRHVVVADKGVLYVLDTWLGTKRILIQGRSKAESPAWSPLM